MPPWTENFKEAEFTCKCGCGASDVDGAFLTRLEVARDFYRNWVPGGVFPINSGCRCEIHNAAEGGNDSSQHLVIPGVRKCNAADIKATGGRQRFFMVRALIQAGFVGVGVADTYIHCDTGLYQPYRPSLWTYR